MSDGYQKPVHSLVLYGDQIDYLAHIVNQWLGEGFSVDGPCVDFASALFEQLTDAAAARRV